MRRKENETTAIELTARHDVGHPRHVSTTLLKEMSGQLIGARSM